jgi:hypothetical protein
VSRHVPPHRWADAFAGALADDELADLEAHAEQCSRCARARDRVQRASQSFPALRAQSSPDLAWDGVRARVHWEVSQAQRQSGRQLQRSRAGGWIAASLVAAGAVALAVTTGSVTPPTARGVAPEPLAVAPAPRPVAIAGLVSRLTGQLMVDGVRRDDAFARVLTAGTVLATGDGRVDVQFDDRSAFALGARSSLELRRFDAEVIELVVDGTIDVTVAPRAAEQRFVVVAGGRTIEVRGTQFRVVHDDSATRVACRHGKVAVRDASGEVELGVARKLAVGATSSIADARVVALSAAELDELAEATPVTLPLWTDPHVLVQTSAALEVATSGARGVRVDGVELGDGPLRVRVMPGRHTVETADRAGRFRRAGWVDVEAAKPARIAVQIEAAEAATRGTATRRKQLRAAIDHARLSQCTRAITKSGLTAYVTFEISIDESGAVQFLNVVDTDLPSTTRSCVRDVLADIQFKPGAAATFRDKLDL